MLLQMPLVGHSDLVHDPRQDMHYWGLAPAVSLPPPPRNRAALDRIDPRIIEVSSRLPECSGSVAVGCIPKGGVPGVGGTSASTLTLIGGGDTELCSACADGYRARRNAAI